MGQFKSQPGRKLFAFNSHQSIGRHSYDKQQPKRRSNGPNKQPYLGKPKQQYYYYTLVLYITVP